MSDQWQSISTFPTDGRFYLCEDETGRMAVLNCPTPFHAIGLWEKGKNDELYDGFKLPGFKPVMWRELPEGSKV